MKHSIKIIRRTSFVLMDISNAIGLPNEALAPSIEFVVGKTPGFIHTNARLNRSDIEY